MDKSSPILIIIPARGGSKRLIGKNKVLLNGLPLFMHSVNAVRKVKKNIRLIVSTDDNDIVDYCYANNIGAKYRPPILALDYAAKQDVIVDVCKQLWEEEFYIPNTVVSLQANSPEVNENLLTNCLERFKNLSTVNGCKELICINKNGKQNGAIRIMTYKTVFQKTLSTYLGSFTQDLTDIHTREDLNCVDISKLWKITSGFIQKQIF